VTDDLRKIVTSVFRSGKGSSLSTVEFVNTLSLTLRFFTLEKAKKVHQASIRSGLILPDSSGRFVPAFDIEGAEVEPDYRPPDDLDVDMLSRPLSDRLIEAVCRRGMDRKDAIKAINRTSESLNLVFAAAAVHVGIENGIDMSAFYGEVETTLLVPQR
jgi:hypothetical protein